MHTDGMWLKDNEGRTLILRGVNLSGSTKVPAVPDGSSRKKDSLLHPADVSFINRPFPLEEADEHFRRLKSWGFTFLRFLITWEAVEHKGPGQYDEEYLDYLEKVIAKAAEYRISVFIDPHNDMWSRWTGGDGAPGWTMEMVGMDILKLHETGAAVVHSFYKGRLPRMIWTTNQHKLGACTMFSLFFGGNTFAPETKMEGEPVQEYLQRHYIDAMRQVVLKLANAPNVTGYETLNEPFQGYIGHDDLAGYSESPVRIGLHPTPYESMLLASGYSFDVPFYTMNGFPPKIKRYETANPGKEKLWKKGFECIWKTNGVWSDESGMPELLRPHHFQSVNGKKADFENDFLKPFMVRYLKEMRKIQQKTIVFLDCVPGRNPVTWSKEDGENVVNAGHWYDVLALFLKQFRSWLTISHKTRSIVFGRKKVLENFIDQQKFLKECSASFMGGIPTIMSEFGLPFDLDNKKSYRTGDFRKHVDALNTYFNALDANLLSGILWNYTPDNTNELGDRWNEEDLSIFSTSQQKNPADINSGARAISGFCRPYAMCIAGEPLSVSFILKKRLFRFTFRHDPRIMAPTIVFVPRIQYPDGFSVTVNRGRWESDDENSTVSVFLDKDVTEGEIIIRPE